MEWHPLDGNMIAADQHYEGHQVGDDEGAICNRDGCDGRMEWKPVENCSCHINPPCPQCENQSLWCPECGEELE